jgi:hypothetical protein
LTLNGFCILGRNEIIAESLRINCIKINFSYLINASKGEEVVICSFNDRNMKGKNYKILEFLEISKK